MRMTIKMIKENKLYTLFSFLFLFFLISSFVFYYGTGFGNFVSLFGVVIVSLILSPVMMRGVVWLCDRSYEPSKRTDGEATVKMSDRFMPLIYVTVLFILQMPVFLAFYPGIIFYDIGTQIEQYETGMYAANHPLIHTLFMGYMKNLYEDPNRGYALATIIQLLIADSCISYVLAWLKKNTRAVVAWGLLLFIGLNPVFSLLFISSTKDIIFAALLSVVFVDLIRIIAEDVSLMSLARMVIIGILMILMRSNAAYAFIPSAAVLLLIFRKSKALLRRIIIYLVCVVVLGIGINKILIASLDAYKGSIKEMMSIPAQIDGRIYLEVADSEEQELIRKYIPEPEQYNYYISDPIKKQFEFDTVDSQCKHYLLDTTILALKHPIVAIDAVMYNTQGFWDMFHSAYQEEHQYVARSGDYRGGATTDSKLPGLMSLYMEHFRLMDFEGWNLLAVFAQMGIYIWMLVFALTKSVKQGDKAIMAGCLLMFIYLLTVLLGPSAIMRYGLPFMIVGPVAVALSFVKKE